jgi:hypothetical protein
MANTRQWNTGIVARGRIYFAASNKVYAFAIPWGILSNRNTGNVRITALVASRFRIKKQRGQNAEN